ncbi:MAG TPA: malto-oligosyltrehalose trehalohydrolase [Mucilaginibacter sp.]
MKKIPGIRFNSVGQAEITVWAPLAKSIEILLIGTRAKNPLNQTGYGYWELTTNQLKPNDLYQFILDNKKPLPDVASLSQPEGVHGPSKAIDLHSFEWNDEQWENLSLEKYIIYELHTGTFTPEGTFETIASKLDYLKDLGITAIEIMPVAQFPGERNWGYDGAFPYAVQNSYGGAYGLMHLIDTCHKKGIAVILDVVYNHMGPEGNYFTEYGPYFTDKYHTPWGNAINFDDAWCDGVRNYFIENALMWFKDFHIDALRLDAVHAIKDFSPVHILRDMKQRIDHLMADTGKTYHLIVELDLNDPRFIDPLEKQGYGMDAQWIDEFHHALSVTAGGERNGYYSDFTGIGQLAKSYNDAYVYNGIYSPHRQKIFGSKATANPGDQFIVFSQNHDQVGNRMLGERSSQLFSFEMQKLMAGAVMVASYLPLLFMGEEWSAQTPFLYFTSHNDPELAKAVREGRKTEFKAFHVEAEAPDPQADETFIRSKLQWDKLTTDNSQKMLNYYQTLIAIRKEIPALHVLDRKALKTIVDEDKQLLMLNRWYNGQQVYCIMNFSKTQQIIPIPEIVNWQKVLDSADSKWNGPGSLPTLNIQPESLIIYLNNHV